MQTFDYVIVGGGSAGCVLASRLSEDPAVSVCLLEAGGDDRHPFIHMPKGMARLLQDPRHMYFYQTVPEVRSGGRPDYWVRGKGLGGSSSVNGMVYVKGQPADFDGIAALAGDDWSWQHIARAYEEMESHDLGLGEGRGASGPLHVSVPMDRTLLTEAICAAGGAVGWPVKEDVHQPDDGEGIGYVPRNIWKGKRQSASVAFLRPAMQRRNLTVITGALADRVVFEGKRAVAVACLVGGAKRRVGASSEVILCASCVASPGILERSGIGDPARLDRLGIPLVHAQPAVGEDVTEHRGMRVQWRLKQPLSQNRDYRGWKLYRSVIQYYLTRTGPMASAAMEMRAAFRSRPGLNRPDTQALFGLFDWELTTHMGKLPGDTHGFHALIYPLRPQSLGSIHIGSTDPMAPPEIVTNYGADEEDRRVITGAVRCLREFARAEPLASLIEIETEPGPEAESDEQILAVLDSQGAACLHSVGSCRMGRDAASVVDPELRVRGVEGLRVMDTSVMPVIPAGNTNAPTMAMAWRAAEVIRRG
jgi:choline dehydrogenase